jgi:hypothetical protein
MNKVILVCSEDWEGLYINGKLVKEGHTLNEGTSRIKYFLKLSKEYDFDLDDMKEVSLSEDDEIITQDVGNYPEDIEDFVEDYQD